LEILFVLAIVTEFVVEQLKKIVPYLKKDLFKIDIERLVALAVGALFTFYLQVDFLQKIGFEVEATPEIGYAVSALFVAAGAGIIYDLIEAIEGKVDDFGS